jgi:hypothetical protein
MIWRVLFWAGILSLMFGTGLATAYVNNDVSSQAYLIGAFAVIFLGVGLMATGYFVSRGRIRIQNIKPL